MRLVASRSYITSTRLYLQVVILPTRSDRYLTLLKQTSVTMTGIGLNSRMDGTRRNTSVLRMYMNAMPDYKGRVSGKPRYGITINDLVGDRNINNYFITDNFISFREVFNNLDGDGRAMSDYICCTSAGTLMSLASMHAIDKWKDDIEDAPRHVLHMIEDFKDMGLTEMLDTEFPALRDQCIDYISSYLFGRIVLTDSFSESNPDTYETMYEVCEDLLWRICAEIGDIVSEIECLADIIYTDDTLFLVARWEEDYFDVTILGRDNQIPESTAELLLDRGLINEQRYNDLHRRG